MSLKEEISDFLKTLRQKSMPKTSEMAKLAMEKYESRHGKLAKEIIIKDFSSILANLIKIEHECYKSFNKELIEKSLLHFSSKETYKKEYPVIHSKIMEAQKILAQDIDDSKKISKINQILYPYNHIVSFSSMQSAKSRVGKSLENHMEYLLSKLGYKFETQKHLKAGEVLDFIFPSLEKAKTDPHSSMVAECQTTLKEEDEKRSDNWIVYCVIIRDGLQSSFRYIYYQ